MAKLGTEKKPIRFRVQTEERLSQIAFLCDQNGWVFIGEYEPDEPEDISEVEYMLNLRSHFNLNPVWEATDSNIQTITHKNPKIGRNEPCQSEVIHAGAV